MKTLPDHAAKREEKDRRRPHFDRNHAPFIDVAGPERNPAGRLEGRRFTPCLALPLPGDAVILAVIAGAAPERAVSLVEVYGGDGSGSLPGKVQCVTHAAEL